MKITRVVPVVLTILIAAGCQRGPSPADLEADRRRQEQLQQLDQKIAQLQDLEKQATDRKLSESEQRAANSERDKRLAEQERQKAEREREALQKERDRLARDQQQAEGRARDAEQAAQDTARRADQERSERTVDLFYTALQPQGDWFEVERYGFVWQPGVATNPDWRPYTDGRWVFTEYGWFWKSNEPFGWAAYHYGRWAKLRRIGWVWIPGTEWGPAWVSWRRSDRYVGWAPLPPDAWSGSGFTAAVDSYYDIGPGSYTFVPVEDVGEPTYVGHVIAPVQNVTIVNQTVNVTNITYTKVQNNTVIYNAGPDLNVVNARAARKVPQLKVERVTNVGDGKNLGRTEQQGSTLVVNSPNFVRAKNNERPQRIKENVKAPEVEKGWSDLDKTASDQARQRIKAEATDSEEKQRRPVAKPLPPADTVPPVVAKPASERPPVPIPTLEKPAPATPFPSAPKRPEPSDAVPAKPVRRSTATPVQESVPGKEPAGERSARPPEVPWNRTGRPSAPVTPVAPDSVNPSSAPGGLDRPKVDQPGKPPAQKQRPAQPAVPEIAPNAAPAEPPVPIEPGAATPLRKLPKALKSRPETPAKEKLPDAGQPNGE